MIMLLGMTVAVSAKEYTSDSIGSDGIYLEDGDEVDIIGKTLLIDQTSYVPTNRITIQWEAYNQKVNCSFGFKENGQGCEATITGGDPNDGQWHIAAAEPGSGFDYVLKWVAATNGDITLGAGALTKNSKVYFGDQILWRVLHVGEHKDLSVCGAGKALLISDNTLADIQFNPDKGAANANVWADSNAQTWCRNYYTNWPAGIERDAILATTVVEAEKYTYNSPHEKVGTIDYGPASLNDECFFFLSVKEAVTLFKNDDDRKASGADNKYKWWWLRSPTVNKPTSPGNVDDDGWVHSLNHVEYYNGARPAFNLDLSTVLFTSEIQSASEPQTSYKLTLKDDDLNIGITNGKVMTWNGSTATIPYTISGTRATDQTKAYVLVTDKAYTESDAQVLQYTELGTGKSGTGTFALDTSKASGTQGENYQIYLVAVNESGDKKSDYAGTPAALPYELRYDANGGTKTMKSQNIFDGDTFTFPDCGFTAPKGKAFDYWEMSGVDSSSNNMNSSNEPVNGVFHPGSTVKIASNCAQNNVITVTAYWKDAPAAGITSAPAAKNLTYTGSAQELVTAGEADGGTMQYALGSDAATAPTSGWSKDIPKKTAAGTYYVWYKAIGDESHSDSEAKCCTAKIQTRPDPKPKTGIKKMAPKAMKAKGKTKLVIRWGKVDGARGYDIFLSKCGKNTKCKKIKTIKGNKTSSWTKTGLKTKTPYKAYVKAWVKKGGKKKYIAKTPTFHVYTANETKHFTNAKSITVKKTKVSLKVGKTYKIKAKINKINENKKLMPACHTKQLRYMSSNEKIATVDGSGRIEAKSAGTCRIYVFAANGVNKAIKVTVVSK